MATKPNNATIVETCARRIRALGSYVDRGTKIGINGRKHAHAEVVATYQRCLDARANVARLRAQLAEALDTVAETEVARVEADAALKGWARGEFGVESMEAIELGFPAPKKTVRTVEAKVLAVARGKATREARHTMGRKQKEAIRGTFDGAVGAVSVPPGGPVGAEEGVAPTTEPGLARGQP